MKPDQIEVGKVYRMRGRKLDRRVLDIISLPDLDKHGNYKGEYQVAIVEIISLAPDPKPVREYLPWFARDAIAPIEKSLARLGG
jgi:hypothetical protein